MGFGRSVADECERKNETNVSKHLKGAVCPLVSPYIV